MMWLYDIPTWLQGILITAATVAICVGGYVLLHRLFPGERSDDVGNVAISFISVICAFHSLLLAFSAVLVWQDFQDSETAVAVEANTVEDIYRDLRLYGGDQATAASKLLLDYVRVVVDEEWPLMAEGRASETAADLIDRVFLSAGSLSPETPREQVIFSELFRHLNELMNNRHERLQDSQSEMPAMFWVIVLIATGLLIAYTGVLPYTSVNLVMVAGMAASIGLIFFFIVALDHPFAGDSAVEATPFQYILDKFEAKRESN